MVAIFPKHRAIASRVYGILACRRYRAGSAPTPQTTEQVLQTLGERIASNEPIALFQFWGGCKNPNLPYAYADFCEAATLDNLHILNTEIRQVYPAGLRIYISPGDVRVQRVNAVPVSRTSEYVKSLTELARNDKYDNLFTVVPLSELYTKYSSSIERKLVDVRKRISADIPTHHEFDRLVLNSISNVYRGDLDSVNSITARAIHAAKEYIVFRVAEEETKLFNEFSHCIRSFFIKYAPFYKRYIQNIDQTVPNLDCSLVFFTGGKGNVTQPWQAISTRGTAKVFLSQKRLAKLKDQSELLQNAINLPSLRAG